MINQRLKVLFICAMNKQRSATAERIYRNDPRVEVRSAGVRAEANRRVSEADLRWADVVFAMEHAHKRWIAMRFEGLELPPIDVLEIPDDFEFMDPELQEALRLMLDPEIDRLVSDRKAE
ncbi:MAG: protein-tyrosine-phosphatase [Chthoniobacter sp.]|nr:protein-tyrosine-phosphatase [Chthoniobacter sp.]